MISKFKILKKCPGNTS